jgi:hypothetical protein
MTNKNCLNCENKLTDKYCSCCGQKANTHRISFKNFIFHDVLHGTFHIDKGMLFTAKQALTRPGKAALDYIAGKRIIYYNVFYLIMITTGLLLFCRHFLDELYISEGEKVIKNTQNINAASKTFEELFSQKSKIIIFLFVPFAAFNSFILFKRKKLYLSEHAIISGMLLLGMLLIALFGNLFFYFDFMISFNDIFSVIISWLVTALIIFHVGFGYYNAFSSDYSKFGISCRIVLFYVLICIEIAILFLLVFGFITNWKFGYLHFSPF